MTLCPDCVAARARNVIRGRLRVTSDPPAVYWRGDYIKLTPAQVKIMRELARHKMVTHFLLEMVCVGENATARTVAVQICLLRKKLPAGIGIKNHHGEGYELELEDEQ
jgi:DNA-binding response OmpR family regulator